MTKCQIIVLLLFISLKRLLKSNYAFQNEKKIHMKQRKENYNNRFKKSEKGNE